MRLSPTPRQELVRRLKRAGFEGPFPGGNHQFLCKDALRVRLANPHGGDIGAPLLSRILKQAGVSSAEWLALG